MGLAISPLTLGIDSQWILAGNLAQLRRRESKQGAIVWTVGSMNKHRANWGLGSLAW